MKKTIFLILILFSFNLTFSQVKGISSSENNELYQMEMENQMGSEGDFKTEAQPVGNVIDPKYYKVGPGDLITIQSLPPISGKTIHNLEVAPDVSLMLPRSGKLDIAGMTLFQVEEKIREIYQNMNKAFQISIGLKRSRNCIVSIRGNVIFPSNYTLPAAYRISTSVLFANQIQKSQVPSQQMEALLQIKEKQRETERLFSESGISSNSVYWTRNITILHNDGTSSYVDLEKAAALNSPEFDPYLREGDQIIVPFEKDNYPRLSISGAINRPILLPYKTGDKASLLLKFGYGLTEKADLNNVYLNLPASKRKIQLKIDKNLNLLSEDIELEPGTTIVVGQIPEPKFHTPGVVSVKGEVNIPGNYLIEAGVTRLKDIITDAGGFTEEAYLPLAHIIRRENNQNSIIDPRRETYEVLQYSDLTMDDTVRYFIDMKYKQPLVSVDFEDCFIKNQNEDNVLLLDGDVITIPSNPGKVFVFGQVNSPGYVEFSEGKTMEWYIEKAGGAAEGSQKHRARIIRGRTNVWIEGDEKTVVYAGDRVYIPRIPDEPTHIKLARYSIIAGAISTLFGVINIIYNLNK